MTVKDQHKLWSLIDEAYWWTNSQQIDVYISIYSKWDYHLTDGYDNKAIFCYRVEKGTELENIYDELCFNLSFL